MFEPKFPRITFFFGTNLKIADFEVIANLGKGSYGQVNLYRHLQTRKQYAIKKIKLFKQGKKTISPQELEMLTRKELQILYKLDSKHIIKLIDHFEDKESVYLITEFINGINLYEQTLKISRHLSNEVIADIIYQICEGLQELHENHIIHRDIKLQNIIYVTQLETVIIVDLGCSNFYGQNISRQTTIGTRLYYSPQIMGQEEQNDRLDVWCVGVVLYELLFLEQPFTGQDIELKIRKCEYNFPGYHVPEPELEDLFRKVFTNKNNRLTAKQLKNHSWVKKYRQRQDHIKKRFESYFTTDQVQNYSQFLKTNSVNNSLYLEEIKIRTQKLETLLKEARRQLRKK